MRKKRLYLMTDSFPYGKGEKSFILPELSFLQERFDVTVISAAPLHEKRDKSQETLLPDEIKVIHYAPGSVKKWEVIPYIVPFLLWSQTWMELKFIIREKKRLSARIKKELYFYANALKLSRWLEQKNIFKKDEPVICYSYWYNEHVLSAAFVKKKHPDMKIVTRAHGYDLYAERNDCCWQPYKRTMDHFVDQVFFISAHGADYYKKHYAADIQQKNKYHLCRLGVAPQKYLVKREKSDPFILVSCSNLVPVKRVELIIEALSGMEDRRVHWVHFGDGPEYESLLSLAKARLDGKENIIYEFKGNKSNEAVLEYYQTEMPDCFIITSASEGSPVSIQEALAFGMPVIATKVGGVPEMFDDNGILLGADPKAEEIAEAIKKIYDLDASDYRKCQEHSYRIWEKDYNQTVNAQMFGEILNGVI